MPSATFYSDRTGQPQPRVREEISAGVWRGLVDLVARRIGDGSLAAEFPSRNCLDYPDAITGTDRAAFETALEALVPDLRRAPDLPSDEPNQSPLLDSVHTPATPVALDVIDFVAQHIANPVRERHGWMRHEHHWFHGDSREQGQDKFRDEVELISDRNGIAFTVGEDMKTARLGPLEARALLGDFISQTGDSTLDELLRDASTRFLSRDPQNRVVALEKLWKAFERLKTV